MHQIKVILIIRIYNQYFCSSTDTSWFFVCPTKTRRVQIPLSSCCSYQIIFKKIIGIYHGFKNTIVKRTEKMNVSELRGSLVRFKLD